MTVKKLFAELANWPLDSEVYFESYTTYEGIGGTAKKELIKGSASVFESTQAQGTMYRPNGPKFEAVVLLKEK